MNYLKGLNVRKSRIKFTEVEESLLELILDSPEKFLENLEELSIKIPSWSKLLLLVLAYEKQIMEVLFFEDTKDFFFSYTKKILRYSKSDLTFICYNREEDNWRLFIPPTLIGPNLKTQLRKKM